LATSPGSSYRNWRCRSVSFSGFTAQWLWRRFGRILTKQSWSIRFYGRCNIVVRVYRDWWWWSDLAVRNTLSPNLSFLLLREKSCANLGDIRNTL
jgi:hypothetical protein